MKKSWFYLALTAAVVIGMIIGYSIGYNKYSHSEIKENPHKVVKMGVVLPLDGNSAKLGEPKKRAFEIAMEQYNAQEKKLEVLFQDSQGNANGGVSAFNNLLLNKDIDCYYIDLTPIVNACVPLINEKKVITFAGSAEPEITERSDYLFRIFAGGEQEIELMVDYLHQDSINKVFILHTNELYGINACKYFESKYTSDGGMIVGKDEYPMNNGDFKSQLMKAKAAQPEKIILLGYGNEYPVLFRQAAEFGLSPDVFVCNLGGSNKAVMELPADLTEGVTIIGPRFSYLLENEMLEPEMKSFVDKYRAKFNENPDFRAAYAYDMVMIYMGICGNESKTQQQIIDTLLSIKNFSGASGTISFKENGDTETDLITARYENGRITLLSNND